MFEGVVSQVLAGYLGRYVKNIQKEQLKIGLWNEEILLENVELILDAFDYLQLPLTLKDGRIGKLSIKIPWKRLGWEPIIVVLEDVFLCASQRDDNEWGADAVERRKLAGKMAKLNAIELAKFSKRVSDKHAGQSFISYITTKVLDNIQVSVKRVHIIYLDSHNSQGEFVFGLKFSTLTIMTDTTKLSSNVSSVGKPKNGQVSKILEISSVGLYCNVFEEAQKTVDFSALANSEMFYKLNFDNESYSFILLPFDVKIYLLANKSGKFGSAYAIDIELTNLEATISELQLRQILSLTDYFSICALRERYGRFRPPQISLCRKPIGWQRVWWQYAQNAVLADVHHKLWKTSWKSLGKRIIERRKYVNLYKRKLELIQQEQTVCKNILQELEVMDKECCIDDILNYRFIAEQKLQELLKMKIPSTGSNDERAHSAALEKHQHDRSSSGVRRWMNWLSLGMLGAGGTADSNSFAGVVSDEIIKDIYEVTEFNPIGSFNDEFIKRETFLSSLAKLNISQISATIFSKYEKKIVVAIFDGIKIDYQSCETSSTVVAFIDSVTVIDPFNDNFMLAAKKAIMCDSSVHPHLPFVNIHINMQKFDRICESSIKVSIQPFEATYESDVLHKVLEFCDVLVSYEFLHKRVLLSLNGLKSFKDRLFFKLLELEGLFFKSMPQIERLPKLLENSSSYDCELTSCLRDIIDNGLLNLQLKDFYDQFEVGLTEFEVKLFIPKCPAAVSITEKCNVFFEARVCILVDEPILKPFEVNCTIALLHLRFSPAILSSFMKVYKLLENSSLSGSCRVQCPSEFDKLNVYNASYSSFSLKLDRLNIHVNIDDNLDNDSGVIFSLNKIDARITDGKSNELCCFMETIMFALSNLKHEQDWLVLCTPKSGFDKLPLNIPTEYDDTSLTNDSCDKLFSGRHCFQLHYRTTVEVNIVQHEFSILLSESDLHVYPRIFGLLASFFNRVNEKNVTSSSFKSSLEVDQDDHHFNMVDFEYAEFGICNFSASKLPMCGCISVDNFPFVTISSSDLLSNLNSLRIHSAIEFQGVHAIDKFCIKSHMSGINKRPATIMSYSTTGNVNCTAMNEHQFTQHCNVFLFDIKVNNVKVHFHDSSCILGAISIPKCTSIILLQGASCWDVVVSMDGLSLSSSWFSDEVVWGPLSLSRSPVLNIRARKEEKKGIVEINFSIQNVSCILTSEFLSMLIGYFSLPDWTSKRDFEAVELYSNFSDKFDKHPEIIYKFEILDSLLFLPSENHANFILKVNIPRLYCNFVSTSSPDNACNDIPFDCVVTSNAIANKLDMINLFGRSMSFSVTPMTDVSDSLFKHCKNIANDFHFIEQLDADVWLRIPCEMQDSIEHFDFPSLIMMRVDTCKLIIEEEHFITGIEAIVNVADQLSMVTKESEMFKSDALQFMQLKKKLKDEPATIPNVTADSFVIMKICVKALSINFYNLNETQSSSLEVIAKAFVSLVFSATLLNGLPKSLDVNISNLLLHSFLSDVLLMSFNSNEDLTSRLLINFSKSIDRVAEIVIVVSALDIWLHLPDWDHINTIFDSCKGKLDMNLLSKNATLESQLSYSASNNVWDKAVPLIVKSDSVMISFHLPLLCKEENLEDPKARYRQKCQSLDAKVAEDASNFQSETYRHVKIILQSKFVELTLRKNHVNLKCNVEKIRTNLEMAQNREMHSLPFIYISQVKLESEVHAEERLMRLFIDVQIDSADVGLSYQVFKFWNHSWSEAPETAASLKPSHCIVLKVSLMKGALLLSDGRWNFHGPILEILIKGLIFQLNSSKDSLKGSGFSNLLMNYNNIDKVMWEPFVEPWSFQLSLEQKLAGSILIGQSATTVICMESSDQLNLNITEPLIEALFRLQKMISDILNESDEVPENLRNFGYLPNDEIHVRRYAPYIFHNDTSLPLAFHVFRGPVNTQDNQSLTDKNLSVVQPGFSIPIYVEETLDEHFFRRRRTFSSELLVLKKHNTASHHMISIHFDGTSGPSKPLSMDLVGLSCFEVNFSIAKESRIADQSIDDNASDYNWLTERQTYGDHEKGLVVPVVFDVSMLHYSKMIRLYSTVLLLNTTPVPLELRFDIPFGVSPKILDPLLPGQEAPMPLHLAETGQIRWHPVGTNYLWSEAQSLMNILSPENRLGFLRSFVCYPAHPTNHPFRCCMSVQDFSLSSSCSASPSLIGAAAVKSKIDCVGEKMHEAALMKKHTMHRVKLKAPLLLKNYLPVNLALMLESGGVTHTVSILEGKFTSIFSVDSMHDLEITFQMEGYMPVISKFPRAELFSKIAKTSGSKHFLLEKTSFYPYRSTGPLSVTLEKILDASCGAREISLSVSYLLYNCTGLQLAVVDENRDHKGVTHVIAPSYLLMDQTHAEDERRGLAFLSCVSNSLQETTGDNAVLRSHAFSSSSIDGLYNMNPDFSSKRAADISRSTVHGLSKCAKPYMYSFPYHIPGSDLLVRLAVSSQIKAESVHSLAWSIAFPLVPASGSINVTIPSTNSSSAFLISSTSVAVADEISGKTWAITFQPRFVICNSSSKDLSYKQKGTNKAFSLRVGQHSQLHWFDTSRELLVSLRFNDLGWEWSGSFLPDCLGDVQVKMRNYVSGEVNMVRVEVQNADLALNDENSIPNPSGKSSTQLILLSDDKIHFIPYRIDNFSMERLRIYQQKCESVETTVHPYSSREYAWDEPSYPHRIVIEVPGQRIVGTYNLDNIQDYVPVCLPSTSEKPERRLFVSVHAEGATKVLSIVDSNYHHIVRDVKEKRKADQRFCNEAQFGEVIKIHIPFIGISLMTSAPQELLFACARETTVVMMQSSEQQKILAQMLALQIDNQLPDTPYPVAISFETETRGRFSNHSVITDSEYALYFSTAKWRKPDDSLVSFEHITFRLASLCIELEEQFLLCLLDFSCAVSARVRRTLQNNHELRTLGSCSDASHRFEWGHSYLCGKYDDGLLRTTETVENTADCYLLPSVTPMGAPWQHIYLLARKQKKIYVENFELAPIKLCLSFSSNPLLAKIENVTKVGSSAFQRGIMALVDVEGVPILLQQLMLEHLMASPESMQDILVRHYSRQLLHKIYKLLGSAGVIGNPIGFARNVRLGIKDFLSVSSRRGILQSPRGLLTGVIEGSRSLFSSTIYALSSAASQFTKAAHKGIVAFTFDEQTAAEMDKQPQAAADLHGKAVLNEFLKGLTGVLQSPIRGAEKHGLPGVVSGIAMGTTGLVMRPVASILEATAKTAQSIRNRSSPHAVWHRRRWRLSRPLWRDRPLTSYSWEEAIGASALQQADMGRLKDEACVMCKALGNAVARGKFVVISERLVLVMTSPCMADLVGSAKISGVPANPAWAVEAEMSLESVAHADREGNVLNIVGNKDDAPSRHGRRGRGGGISFACLSVELADEEEAEDALQVLLSAVQLQKQRRGATLRVLHRSNLVRL